MTASQARVPDIIDSPMVTATGRPAIMARVCFTIMIELIIQLHRYGDVVSLFLRVRPPGEIISKCSTIRSIGAGRLFYKAQ